MSDIAVAHGTSPYVTVYPWSSGFGTKYSNPGTLPAGTGRSVAFSLSGNDIAVAHVSSPFIIAYPWSSSGFGTEYTSPGTLPASNAYGVAFRPTAAGPAKVKTLNTIAIASVKTLNTVAIASVKTINNVT